MTLSNRAQGSSVKRRGFLAGIAASALAGCATGGEIGNVRLGVIALHGKRASPQARASDGMRSAFWGVAALEVPDMPWSITRHLATSVQGAHDEIAAIATRLRARGIERLVVAGHSLGGNMALSYAVERGGVDAVVMLAPGHLPGGGSNGDDPISVSVAEARRRVAEGRGTELGTFADNQLGRWIQIHVRADDYLTWWDPMGAANMLATAPRLSPTVPVLMAIGTEDRTWLQQLRSTVFPLLPPNPKNRLVVVRADHDDVPAAARGQVRDWMREVVA